MEIRRSALFGIVGAVLGVAGLVVYLTWEAQVWVYLTLEILAVVHLIAFWIAHFETLKTASERRSAKHGVNAGLMVVVFLSILIIINFISTRHSARFDLSGSGAFSLSKQTDNVLSRLTKPVHLSGFFSSQHAGRTQASDLFESYAQKSKRVTYTLIDPNRKPAVAKQYGIEQDGTIVLESGGGSVTVQTASEEEVTAAIVRVTRSAKKVVYFVEGHGEHDIDDQGDQGYAFVKQAMEKQGFSVKKLSLLSGSGIPTDASVTVVAGAKRPFADSEKSHMTRYLSEGGRLLVMVDPIGLGGEESSGLEDFLQKWGVQLKRDLIVDPTSGFGGAVPIIGPGDYPKHDVTEKFALATFYPLARSVTFDTSKEAFSFTPLLKTGSRSWLTTEIAAEMTIDPNRDTPGPIVFGGVVSRETANDEKNDDMRLVVIGDSDFVTNNVVRSVGNGDLFQNIISWLAEEKDLIAIDAREAPKATLVLNAQQIKRIFYLSVLILPVTLLTTGLFIWRRRRRL